MSFATWVLPTPVGLALVALLGYVVGLRSRRGLRLRRAADGGDRLCAETVIRELAAIAGEVRRNLANHHASILRFKDRVDQLSAANDAVAWRELSREAARILEPTEHLSTQIAHAYDGIRQRANMLLLFHDAGADPLAGSGQRRAAENVRERRP